MYSNNSFYNYVYNLPKLLFLKKISQILIKPVIYILYIQFDHLHILKE